MRVFQAVNGNKTISTLVCPELSVDPITEIITVTEESDGWTSSNINCCTVLDGGDFVVSVTGSLFGKGAKTIIACSAIGDYDANSVTHILTADKAEEYLPALNKAIEECLHAYLAPNGWT